MLQPSCNRAAAALYIYTNFCRTCSYIHVLSCCANPGTTVRVCDTHTHTHTHTRFFSSVVVLSSKGEVIDVQEYIYTYTYIHTHIHM
jgi:hypothetical protein